MMRLAHEAFIGCGRADEKPTGNDELLEADKPRHVILQGGELQRRQEVTG